VATKDELRDAFNRCQHIHREAVAAERSQDHPLAVRRATAALPDQHAAVTFQRRFLNPPAITTPAVDVILRCAPPFFLGNAVEAVQEWFDAGTKTERAALPDIPRRIADARKLLAHAVELWGVLAESPTAVLRPPPVPASIGLLTLWASAGVVAQRPGGVVSYSRVSDPRRAAVAKCAGCGQERTAPLADLLEPDLCPACQRQCNFVLIRHVL
jgi:hypothetical protein